MTPWQILLLAWFGFSAIAIVFLMILTYFNDRRVEKEWSDADWELRDWWEGKDHIQMHKDIGDSGYQHWVDPTASAWVEEEE